MNQAVRNNDSWSRRMAVLVIGVLPAMFGCNQAATVADYLLFGISERDPIAADAATSPATSCASEVGVSTTQIDLVEDGDVTRSYSTTDPFYSDVDANGGTAYGFRQLETCIYPVIAFNGTFEIPLSTNSTYTGRIDVKTSFPAAAAGDWPGSNQNLPAKLVFTGDGTTGHGVAARRCFTVARVIDGVQNPKEDPFAVILEKITTDSSSVYKNKNPCDIAVTVEDDEGPGVRVSSISRVMEEPGGSGNTTAQFFVRLRTAPAQSVTIPINDIYDATNAGRREGTAAPTSLAFDNTNFSIEQPVTVTSADDLEVDGTKTYIVEVQNTQSTDPVYNGIKPRNVVVINNDKSVPGYRWQRFDASNGTSTGSVSGFATDEMNHFGSSYATFQIRLLSKPSANVQLNFSSNNTAISTVQTPTLTFTPTDWGTNQTVTVIGKSDGVDGASANGNLDYTVSFTVTTSDTTYSGQAKPSFVIRSCDNDNTHLIQPCNFSGSPFGTAAGRLSGGEPGATTYMWLIAKDAPGSAITVPLASTDTSEGTVPANVTVDSGNYNVMGTGANRIALSHVDDTVLDGSVSWTVTTGASSGGLVYDPFDVFATTTDNEQRYYVKVTGSTNETDSVQATIHVCLGATNVETVRIHAACASADECGSVTKTGSADLYVDFAPGAVIAGPNPTNDSCVGDPNVQTFTVHGAQDAFADGTQNFTVNLTVDGGMPSATDTVFFGQSPPNQTVANADDEATGKAVFMTAIGFVGEMTLAGVGGADNYCTTNKPAYAPSGTYKALISADGITKRIATTDGSTNAGQVSWVLTPGNYYYRCTASGNSCRDEGNHLFVANSAGLIPFPMSLDFTTAGSNEFWTGMKANMTPATQTSTPADGGGDPAYRDNCAGWTYQNAPSNATTWYYGQTWTENSTNVTSNTNILCTSTKRLVCVQQ